MNLVLWRHAEAEDSLPDLARKLTPRGRKQAARVAAWLDAHLPGGYSVVASPAARTRQTADALCDDYAVDPRLAPGAGVAHYIEACGWPAGPKAADGTVVLVGHQPVLGRLASRLLCGEELDWTIRKGAIWWLSTREREDGEQVVLRAVVGPDLLD